MTVAAYLVAIWPGTGIENGSPTRTSLEQLTAARAAAGASGTVTLLAFGPGPDLPSRPAVGEVDEILAAPDLDAEGNEGYLELLVRLVAERRPDGVVLPNDPRGREVGPRLAGRTGGTAINDAIGVEVQGESTVWSRPCFGDKAVAQVRPRRSPVVATIRPRFFPPAMGADGHAPGLVPLSPPETASRVVSEELLTSVGSGPRLEDAKVVVSGGRGVGGQEEFDRLGELANLLRGVVGASLAAVDEGWARADQQVGLTGKVVSPDVYIAVGISGASQHMAGLAGVKTVVAINSDASAPIFQVANVGAVLDAKTAIPALIAELRRRGA